MERATRLRFREDPSKLPSAEPELAPASDSSQAHLSRQCQAQLPPEETGDPSLSQNTLEDDASMASQQNARRSPARGPGIRAISGPRVTLYPRAFSACNSRDEDRRLVDERSSSPRARRSVRQRDQSGAGGAHGSAMNLASRSQLGGAGERRGGRGGVLRGGRVCPVLALTRDMCPTYSACNPLFRFTPNVPRRVLTVPSTGAGNQGLDNVDFNLIARVNDVLEAPSTSYSVLDLLGQGTFGQVFRCQDHATKDIVAVKVVKNKPAYRTQAMLEIRVAKLLNDKYDPHNQKNIVRLLDYFEFQNHLCLVFELLSINLYELLKQNQFRGLPLPIIRHFIKQILEALEALEQANVIHCDLKPENVLLTNKTTDGEAASRRDGAISSNRLKVIDFGSACYEGQTMYSYIQSRFYRSPEHLMMPQKSKRTLRYKKAGQRLVEYNEEQKRLRLVIESRNKRKEELKARRRITYYVKKELKRRKGAILSTREVLLGLPYGGPIDIWSLGCIAVELFLGLPIFPGVSDHNQICRIVEMIGPLPEFMLENGKDTLKFFKRVSINESEVVDSIGGDGSSRRGPSRAYRHVLKSKEEYARDTNTPVPVLKKYFKHSNIHDIVQSYPMPGAHRRGSSNSSGGRGGGGRHPSHDVAREKEARRVFTHFVLGLLNPNPWKRWTPKQAASHPFITGQPHPRDLGALTIAEDPLISNRYSRQMQAMQLQQQKNPQEAERKHAQRVRHQQRQLDKREHVRRISIPGPSQSRGGSGGGGLSSTPSSISNLMQYQASPMRHTRGASGDATGGSLLSMQMRRNPHGSLSGASGAGAGGGSAGGGDDLRFGPMSQPIDVRGRGSGASGGSGHGDGMGHHFLNRVARGSGAGTGENSAVHDRTARSMGFSARGGAGTSYPPRIGDDDDLDAGPEAYSFGAASFSLGGASSGNCVASDFGYALQRPSLRYEPAYQQNSPSGHGAHKGRMVPPGHHSGGLSAMGTSMTRKLSFTSYKQPPSEVSRGHERGGRALSMDQTQAAPLHYYMGTGPTSSGLGGQLPGLVGRFGPQTLRFPGASHQASSSMSTAAPPGYTSLARGGFLAAASGFHGEATSQGTSPWARTGTGTGRTGGIEQGSQSVPGGPRPQSTSPLFGRPPAMDIPSTDQSAEYTPLDMNLDDIAQDSGSAAGESTSTISTCGWGTGPVSRLPGVESDELSGTGGVARGIGIGGGGAGGSHHNIRQQTRIGRRRDLVGTLGTDPELVDGGNVGASFSFQLSDDGRMQGGTGALGEETTSPLSWMGSGGGVGLDDPEGVHKRSLNGTSKGVSPGRRGSSVSGMSSISPHDESDLIRRVACDDPPGSLPQQLGGLLNQQLQQYQQQQQQHRSRTPFGPTLAGSGESSPARAAARRPQQQQTHSDTYALGSGPARNAVLSDRWISADSSSRGAAQSVLDESNSEQSGVGGVRIEGGGEGGGGVGGEGIPAGSSYWVSSSSTRALRRRASAESSEFYFVDTFQQQHGGGAASTSSYVPPPISPASASTGRSLYVGRSHPSGSGQQQQQHQQQQGQAAQQGHQGQRMGPQRPHRSNDLSGAGGENSWGALASPLQQQQRKQRRQRQQQEEEGEDEEEEEEEEEEEAEGQDREKERQGQERERRREQQREQHLSLTTRSTVTSRGFGNWDGRGGIGVGAPDIIMRGTHEGHFSPEH